MSQANGTTPETNLGSEHIEALLRLSHAYGADPRWVIAGGGNTSVKSETTLTIKASGNALGSLDADGLVHMDRAKLSSLFDRTYPEEWGERERLALADLLEARVPGQGERRPSVETLMHEVLPQTFVVHTHPTLVNGISCATDGRRAAEELFGDDLVWIPVVQPGYILGVEVRNAVDRYRVEHKREPWLLILANHGLVVAGNDEEEVHRRQRWVIDAISSRATPATGTAPSKDRSAARSATLLGASEHETVAQWQETVEKAFADNGASGVAIRFDTDANFSEMSGESGKLEEALGQPFTPDHLVYALRRPVFAPTSGDSSTSGLAEHLSRHVEQFNETYGKLPRVVVVPGLGVFGVAPSDSVSRAASALTLDALLIYRYAQNFGGHAFMPEDQIRFIEGWEVERFRLKQTEGDQE